MAINQHESSDFLTLTDYRNLILHKNKNNTFNDYFCIKYNNYIITNPYFLSLYSAFKIVLPNLLKDAEYEKKNLLNI